MIARHASVRSVLSLVSLWTNYCRYRKKIAREKRSIRVKTTLIWEVGCVKKYFSLVFEKRHHVHDSASRDFYVLSIGLRVGLGSKTAQISGSGRGELRFSESGRVANFGPAFNADSNKVTGTLAVHWWAVTFGFGTAGAQPTQPPPCSTKCNSPSPINGQCTNIVLFDETMIAFGV